MQQESGTVNFCCDCFPEELARRVYANWADMGEAAMKIDALPFDDDQIVELDGQSLISLKCSTCMVSKGDDMMYGLVTAGDVDEGEVLGIAKGVLSDQPSRIQLSSQLHLMTPDEACVNKLCHHSAAGNCRFALFKVDKKPICFLVATSKIPKDKVILEGGGTDDNVFVVVKHARNRDVPKDVKHSISRVVQEDAEKAKKLDVMKSKKKAKAKKKEADMTEEEKYRLEQKKLRKACANGSWEPSKKKKTTVKRKGTKSRLTKKDKVAMTHNAKTLDEFLKLF
ncbi:hypothetical protein J8273_8987 [Carpediemonas membranifera]|uniref:Uncharacterized protein n=1 Tax=Carpediemonas membranifera TaxID=201153 RepID=A0A8J6APN5_9EUKA|nr:hypothetical protein J8273_8987 [Carpediemonas membranifera]|eukprot:KAG9389683.1 hypothetical protein J8273_8987 [Carpediemonas membranifera]